MAEALPMRFTPVPQSVFEGTYGGSLACCQVMLVFYGLSVLQTYLYFIRYESDRLHLKLLVLVLFILSTIHAVFICNTVWHYLVRSYTNPLLLIDGEWSVYTTVAIGVISCFLVQCYFANTIYTLTKGKWRMVISSVMAVLILAQIAFGITLVVELFKLWKLYLLKDAVYIAMIPLFCVRMLSDTVTAATLCIVLYDSTTDFGSTVRLVRTLITYAVNRFLLTTILVAVQTIILIIAPDQIWAMVIEFITVHIYVNSLLATLNAREHLRDIGKPPGSSLDTNSPRAPLTFRVGRSTGGATSSYGDTLTCSVTEEVHVDFGNGVRGNNPHHHHHHNNNNNSGADLFELALMDAKDKGEKNAISPV